MKTTWDQHDVEIRPRINMKTIHDYTEYRYLNFHVNPRVLKLSLDQVLVPRYRYPGTKFSTGRSTVLL